MKRFLQAAFNITLFQVFIVLALAGLKYLLNYYKIVQKITVPYLFILMGAGLVFVIALAIRSSIEDKGHSFEEWKTDSGRTVAEKWMAGFATWGSIIPIVLIYLFFIYLFTPDTVMLFIFFFAGIVTRNIFNFFLEKHKVQIERTGKN